MLSPDPRALTAIYLRNRIESWSANANIPQHRDRNELALPGLPGTLWTFEKQFSRSTMLIASR